jgi:hypothetical protein
MKAPVGLSKRMKRLHNQTAENYGLPRVRCFPPTPRGGGSLLALERARCRPMLGPDTHGGEVRGILKADIVFSAAYAPPIAFTRGFAGHAVPGRAFEHTRVNP